MESGLNRLCWIAFDCLCLVTARVVFCCIFTSPQSLHPFELSSNRPISGPAWQVEHIRRSESRWRNGNDKVGRVDGPTSSDCGAIR